LLEALKRCSYHAAYIDLGNVCDNHTARNCGNCVKGRGNFIPGGEDKNFGCNPHRDPLLDYTPDPKPGVTPETPGCEHHVTSRDNYYERMELYAQKREERERKREAERWPAFDPEAEGLPSTATPEMARRMLQHDNDQSRQYNKAFRPPGR
jgi:hypothetical protein